MDTIKHPNKEVVAWLEKAGAQGHMEAQLMLGKIYQFGRRGIPNAPQYIRRSLV